MSTLLLFAVVCNATIFGYKGDEHAGGSALFLKRPVNNKDVGIAHRTLPLGSKVVVQNLRTKSISIATVVDRGPYGAVYEDTWVLKLKKADPGQWRGCVDLTPALARGIHHSGYEKVVLRPLTSNEYKVIKWVRFIGHQIDTTGTSVWWSLVVSLA